MLDRVAFSASSATAASSMLLIVTSSAGRVNKIGIDIAYIVAQIVICVVCTERHCRTLLYQLTLARSTTMALAVLQIIIGLNKTGRFRPSDSITH